MPAKKKPTATFARQLSAAHKARKERRWETAIANYTRALAHKKLSVEIQIELLEGRASCYKKTGEAKAQAADLEKISGLQRELLEERELARQQAGAELEIVSSIAEALVDQADYEQIGRIVGKKLQEFFKAEIAGIGFYDESSGTISVPYYYERGKIKKVPPFKYGEGVTSHVLKTRKPIYLPTAKESEKYGVIYVDELPAETMLMAPIISRKKALGTITIQHSQPYAYGKHELEILAAIAASMAVALENARLFDETAQRNAELAVITSVQDALAKELDLMGIYRIVGRQILELFNAQTVTIRSVDVDKGIAYFDYILEKGKELSIPPGPISGAAKYILELDKPFLLNEDVQQFLNKHRSVIQAGEMPKSFMAVPYKKRGSLKGGITIENMERENAFSQSDAKLLGTIANSMSVALDNARLFDEIQKRNREISENLEQQTATSDILRVMANSPTEVQPILDAVANNAARLCKAEDVQIYIVDGDRLSQIAHSGPLRALKKGETLPLVRGLVVGRAVLERRSIHIEDFRKISGAEYPESVKLQKRLGHRTGLAMPLVRNKIAIGAIAIRRNVVRPFTERQISLLATFADQAAIAIENVRLFKQLETRNREVTESLELQTATSEIMQVIASSPEDVDSVLEIIAEKAARLSDSDAAIGFVEDGFIKLRAHYGTLPFWKYGEGVKFNHESVAGEAILSGKPNQALHNIKGQATRYPVGDAAAKKFGYKMTFAAPLLSKGEAKGVIVIRRAEPKLLTEKEIALLQSFADQASIAIEKAGLVNETNRLLEETTRRNAELGVINSVQQGLASKLKFQEIVDLVGEKVGEIFNADTVNASMYDAQRDWRLNWYYADRGRRIPFADGPVRRPSLTAVVIDSRKPLLLGTKEEAAKLGARLQPATKEEEDQNESILFVPILAGKNVVGVISVQSYKKNAFNQNDLHLLETLANSMSVALENARLFDETAQRNAELAVINSVQQGLASKLKFQEIVDLVGEKVGEIFRADTVVAVMYDVQRDWATNSYYVDRGRRVEIPDGPMPRPSLTATVIDTKKPLLIGTTEESEKLGAIRRAPSEGEQDQNESILYVPILAGKNVIGGISAQSYSKNAFNENDLHLMQTLANSMSVALENARLFDETAQRNAELAVINSVQEAMARQLDIKGIYEAVGEKIKDIFQPEAMILGAFDLNASLVYPYYFYEQGERLFPEPFPFSGLVKHIISAQKSVVINENFAEKKEELGMREVGGADTTKSGIWVPLLVGSKVIGLITLQSDHENSFSAPNVRLLETLANGMSVALENARLFDETSRRNAELAVITSVQEAMAKQLDIKGIYEAVGEKIKEVFQPQGLILSAYDHETHQVLPFYMYEDGERLYSDPFPFSGLAKTLITRKKTVLINEDFASKALEIGMVTVGNIDEPKSALFVPLIAGDKVIGMISLQIMDRENAFSESDVRLLETLANSMSVAVENARLFDETAQRNAELAVINSVQEGLASRLKFQEIVDLVGQKVGVIFNADTVYAAMYDAQRDWLLNEYYVDRGRRIAFTESPLPRPSPMAAVVDGRQPLLLGTFEESEKLGAKRHSPSEGEEDQNESLLIVPILAGEKMIGLISVQSYQTNAFNQNDLHLLQTLANSMSVALENARLFDETAQRNAELAVINSVQEAVAKQMDIQGIYEAVGDKFKDIFDAQTLFLATLDTKSNLLVPRYVFERGERLYPESIPPSSFSGEAMTTRKTILVNQGFDEQLKVRGIEIREDEGWGELPKSAVYVPLISRDNPIGIISLQNLDRENAFSPADIGLLETLANGMSIALENARLFDETAQRNAELAVITSVQEGIATKLDVHAIYELVGEKLGQVFPNADVTVGRYDASADMVTSDYMVEHGERLQVRALKVDGVGFLGELVRRPRTQLVNENMEQAMQDVGSSIIPGTSMPKSFVTVPLVIDGVLQGVLQLQDMNREHAFSESDVRLLETIASSVSVALENARLFDESAQRNAELAVINTVQAALAEQLDIQTIYDTVGEKLREIFHVGAVTINIYDLEANTNSYVYGFEDGQRTPNITLPINAMHRNVLDQGSTFLLNEGFHEFAAGFGATAPQGKLPKSVLSVQLPKRGNRITSVILMDIEHENAFSQSDVRLLETMTSSMSVALENARLFDESNRLLEESRKKEAELTTVNTVGQAVTSELELDPLIQLIGEQVRNVFKADIAYVALLDEADSMVHFPYLQGEVLEPLKLGTGIVSRVIQSGESLLINRDEGWKEAEQTVDRIGVRSKSYLGVPIQVGKKTIGAISVQSTQKEGRFDEADMHLLSTIAASVGSAIQNARLFAEVARQKEYFETFFEYSPAAVVVVDFDGTVISWNPAAEGLFGYSAQEAVGRDVDDLVANDPRVEAEARAHTKKFTTDLGRVEVKGRRTRKDGSLVDVEVNGLPISVEGELVGLLVIYHDISEIEEARRAAEESNQAKSAFLANMSHELRTPLNAIIGFTRIVRRKGEENLPGKQLENLDKVLVSAEHLLGLINTILDIAKIEAGRMELQLSDFDLAALIDSCLATTQPLVKTSAIQLTKSLPQNLPRMHSDQEKIRQVLLNLLSNAAKFTHEGSIRVEGELKNGTIALSVKDTGIGIAKENLSKVFEEFQQADNTTTRQYGGTGLGLSISRSLAHLLGGDLTATSVEGEGSTFSLAIPLQLGKAKLGETDGKVEVGEAEVTIEPDKPLVLVIDDQPDVFHILQQNLEGAGYQVVGALSGEEGIEKARALHPSAITLDIMMPRKDGWQVLHQLKSDAETKDIPVIILTIVDNKAMGFRLGAADYLVKPLNEKMILEALGRVTQANGGVRPQRLLVVDDDPKQIDLIQQMLQGKDFLLETAYNGAEALERIEHEQPDVILLDLIMPELDGFEFIQEMQKNSTLPKIPIIVLTAMSLSNEELSRLQKSVAKIMKKQGLGSEALIEEIQKVIA